MALLARNRDPFRHFHSRIQREKVLNPDVILHYDSIQSDLAVWKWPITTSNGTSVRITPDNLSEHRRTHDFKAPSCLCAIGDHYMECAIYIPRTGRYFGEYVAGCAENRCKYQVALDRMYARRGLRVGMYYPRAAEAEVPPIINVSPEQFRRSNRQRHDNIRRVTLTSVPRYDRPARRTETVLDQLFRLDAWGSSGLPELRFRQMFAQCQCGLVMTRRVFGHHICAVRTPPVIDLTSDSDIPSVIDLTADSDE